MLEATDIRLAFGRRTVLDGVSSRFDRGWTAIVGPNGAGKSTLLRVLAGLLAPSSGFVTLDGEPLATMPARERGRRLAWFAQATDVSGDLTARETVALGRLPHLGLFGMADRRDDDAVARAMDATACTAWQHRSLIALSGGERQRVLLARALATEASTLLLDEPTTHLDPPHQVALVRLARTLATTHTVVTVLHDLSLAIHADRVLVLRDGRIAADARHDAPDLHRALVDVFDGAVRIELRDGRPVVVPDIDE